MWTSSSTRFPTPPFLPRSSSRRFPSWRRCTARRKSRSTTSFSCRTIADKSKLIAQRKQRKDQMAQQQAQAQQLGQAGAVADINKTTAQANQAAATADKIATETAFTRAQLAYWGQVVPMPMPQPMFNTAARPVRSVRTTRRRGLTGVSLLERVQQIRRRETGVS
jgi:hypothetical protein